jgi:Mg-chelatase subunit ChlD
MSDRIIPTCPDRQRRRIYIDMSGRTEGVRRPDRGPLRLPAPPSAGAAPNRKKAAVFSVKPDAPRKLRNVVGILLDESGSMACDGRMSALLKWWGDQVLNIRKESYDSGQYTLLGVAKFAERIPGYVQFVHDFVPCERAKAPVASGYSPDGETPLLSAIIRMYDAAKSVADKDADKFSSTAILLLVATDGEENSSNPDDVRRFREWLAGRPDNVTIGFIGPSTMVGMMMRYGIAAGNCLTWEGDAAELETSVNVGTQSAYASYAVARSAGKRRTSALFVDVADKAADILRLQDRKAAFKQIMVDREAEIAPFVRAKGLDYVLGKAFYQLTKTERVQPHKKVVLRHKKTGKIVAGEEVKKILGVNTAGDLRLKPGNLGDFDLFVSSTSMNRKLVRGTRLLYAKQEIV